MTTMSLFQDTRKGLLYSLFVAVGSIALFVFANACYVLYESIIWQYTQSYVINAGIIALVSLFTAKLLFFTAYHMVKGKYNYTVVGIVGCFIPVVYPVLFFLGGQQPSSLDYGLMLVVPSVVLGAIAFVFWKYHH